MTNSLHLFNKGGSPYSLPNFRPTFGVESVLIGDRFLDFLPRYWASLIDCSTVIDQVVIAHAKGHEARLIQSLPKRPGFDIQLVALESTEYGADCHNQGIDRLETDWVMFLGLDDQILKGGLDDLGAANESGADILVGGIEISDGNRWMGEWNPTRLRVENTLAAHSPYRKSLWEKVGGVPSIKWIDWGFWALAVMASATAFKTDKCQALLDIGDTHETESGKSVTPEARQRYDQEFFEFARSIGFLP